MVILGSLGWALGFGSGSNCIRIKFWEPKRVLDTVGGFYCAALVLRALSVFREHHGWTQVFLNAPLLVLSGWLSSSSHAALWNTSSVPSSRLGKQFFVRVQDFLLCAFSIFGWIQTVGYSFWLESRMTEAGCAGHVERKSLRVPSGTCRNRSGAFWWEALGGCRWFRRFLGFSVRDILDFAPHFC